MRQRDRPRQGRSDAIRLKVTAECPHDHNKGPPRSLQRLSSLGLAKSTSQNSAEWHAFKSKRSACRYFEETEWGKMSHPEKKRNAIPDSNVFMYTVISESIMKTVVNP